MARQEKTFQAEFRQSLKSLPGVKFYHKIVDNGYQNPFDAVMTYEGISYGLEYKISKNKVSIPLQELFKGREHEIMELRRVKAGGGVGIVLINVFVPHKLNTVYLMDIDQFLSLCRMAHPKKSIKLNHPALEMFPQLKRIEIHPSDTRRMWDLMTLKEYAESLQKEI